LNINPQPPWRRFSRPSLIRELADFDEADATRAVRIAKDSRVYARHEERGFLLDTSLGVL
jgi:hypothetical protein